MEEEHSRQRDLVEVEECVVLKAEPEFTLAKGVPLQGWVDEEFRHFIWW